MGQGATATFHSSEETFPVGVKIDTTNPSRGDRVVRDRIRLIWTVPTNGGRRWWFQCPRTYRKTAKLRVADGSSGVAKPIGSATPANAKDASTGCSEEPQLLGGEG
jgi:hypothetical protein